MEEIFRDEWFVLAQHLDVTISYVAESNRLGHADVFRQQFAACPDSAYIAIIGENASPPSPEIRRALVSTFRDVRCPFAVMVFLQSGFGAALSRSVVTTMARLAAIRFPVLTTTTIAEAVTHVERRFGARDDLERSINELVGLFDS